MKINRRKFRDTRRLKTLFIVVSEFDTATFPVSVRYFQPAKAGAEKTPPRVSHPDQPGVQAC